MKKILISVFDSNMVRNILRTDIFVVLKDSPDISEIILLVHPNKVDQYRKEFSAENVRIEPYPANKPSLFEATMWFFARQTIHTKNVRAKINEFKFNTNDKLAVRFLKYWLALSAFNLSKINFIDWCIRGITKLVHDETEFKKILQNYKPDLVFLPTIFATNDIRLLKACKKNNTATVGMVKSWDNLLGKDPFLIPPDRLVVHNKLVEKYAMEMRRYPKDQILVSGIPQMDTYSDPSMIRERDLFFGEYGFDPKKKLIVYAAVGTAISKYEHDVIKMLAEMTQSNEFCEPVQLLVRLHPAYPLGKEQLGEVPGVTVVQPGQAGVEGNPWRFDFEFQKDDESELISTLHWADIIMQSGSTIAIDAACFDTPIISVGFDGAKEVPLERSAKRLLVKDHFKRILDTEGTAAVYSQNEFIDAVNAYIKTPALHAEGRKKIVEEQCFKLDGKSGERIGLYLLEAIQQLS